MKFRNTKLSKRTMALFASAILLLGSGGAVSTKAAISAVSPNYDATIATNQVLVDLTENGNAVTEGTLYSAVGDKIEPSRTYEDSVGVVNTGSANEYVRVIVRKYWTKDGEKNTDLTPDMIELNIANAKDWIVKDGGSAETKIYYHKAALTTKGDTSKAVLFDTLKISKDVMTKGIGKTVDSTTEDGKTKTVITYTYDYNGYKFNVEAEAQAVQTHNAEDAIKSVWGVEATVSGDAITAIK